jgi:zinc transport system substrate-binding protein
MRGAVASLAVAVLAVALAADAAGPLQVAVSVPPQAYFVERIGGERVRVEVLIPPGASHETYAPSPRQMVAVSRARLYVEVGHPLFLVERQYIEPFLRGRPEIAVVNMSDGITFLHLPETRHEAEEHASAAKQDTDLHVWLAPYTVKIAVQNIARALERIDPAHEAEYRGNLAQLDSDIDALDREVRGLLHGLTRRRFMVYHPAWGYFAREYGLQQVAIEMEGKEPSPVQLASLIKQARQEGMKVIFVEKGFATKNAELVAREIGGRVVELDPLARDWLANMRRVAAAFRRALADE